MPSILLCHLMSSFVMCYCYASSGQGIWTQDVKAVWEGINYNPKIEVLAQSILNRGRPIGPALVPIGGDNDFLNTSYFYGIIADSGAVLQSASIFRATAVIELSATRTKLINSGLLTKKDLSNKIVHDKWEIGIITSQTDDGIKIVYALTNPVKLPTSEVEPDGNSYIPNVITSTPPDVFEVSPNPNTADVSTTSNSTSSTLDDIGLNPMDEKFTKSVGPDPTILESSPNPAPNINSQIDVPATNDTTSTPASNIQVESSDGSSTLELESPHEMESEPLEATLLSSQDSSLLNLPLAPPTNPDIDTATKSDGVAVDSKNPKPAVAPSYMGPLNSRLSYEQPTGLALGVATSCRFLLNNQATTT